MSVVCKWYASDFGRGQAVDIIYLVKNVLTRISKNFYQINWVRVIAVSYTHLRAHETLRHL
eukprot:15345067-Ditylum_brightwellii.AAC.1